MKPIIAMLFALVVSTVGTLPAQRRMGPNETKRFEGAVKSRNYAYKWCRDHRWSNLAYATEVTVDGETIKTPCDIFAQVIADEPVRYVEVYNWWAENH